MGYSPTNKISCIFLLYSYIGSKLCLCCTVIQLSVTFAFAISGRELGKCGNYLLSQIVQRLHVRKFKALNNETSV